MTLMGPLEPEFGVGDINANVMPTLSLSPMKDVRDKETDVATLENIPGNVYHPKYQLRQHTRQ